jgi:ATP-dependent RNA helicase RhlE
LNQVAPLVRNIENAPHKDLKLTNFTALGFSKQISDVLQEIGFTEPTEIQTQTIPVILAGTDIMASAQTGSGKTAAYALPVIELMQKNPRQFTPRQPANNADASGAHTPTKRIDSPRILVIVPTRELSVQVAKEFERFSKYVRNRVVTIYGGTSFELQARALRRGADIIVATPGRLLDHLMRKSADLSKIEILVLDEADRLMDMGFMPQVRRVVSKLPKQRQTLMFSATIDKRIEQIAAEFLIKPVMVRANSGRVEPSEIEQKLFHVAEFGKDALLVKLIKENNIKSMLVFTRTRRKASWVKDRLRDSNVLAEEIHGDISQSKREKTLARYRQGHFSVLVATDVASRGLDIPDISHVINYDLPDTAAEYVHRIGRTGRAGRSGVALSFVSAEQRHLIRDIEKVTGRQLDPNAPARPAPLGNRKQFSGRRFSPRRGRAR